MKLKKKSNFDSKTLHVNAMTIYLIIIGFIIMKPSYFIDFFFVSYSTPNRMKIKEEKKIIQEIQSEIMIFH